MDAVISKLLYQEMWDTRVSTFFKLFNNYTRRKFLNIKTVDINSAEDIPINF